MKKIISAYIIIFVIFTVVFLLLFRSPLFKGQTVLFYRGSFLLALTFFLFAITPGMMRGVVINRKEELEESQALYRKIAKKTI